MARRRKARRQKRRDARRKWPFELLFFGLWAILVLVANFLKDFNGLRFGWAGSYLWGMAFLFSFSLYLLYLLQFVLPLSWYMSVKEGILLIFAPAFPSLSRLVRILLGRSTKGYVSDDLAQELPPSFETYSAGILPSYQSLAITKGPKYERAAGPGYVRLFPGETVAQIIDLRVQKRSVPVQAMTRDGIPIETSVSVTYQVRMSERPQGAMVPYPYDPEALFGVNYLSNYRSEAGVLEWGERIGRKAASILVSELAQYALDELYQPSHTAVSPRKRITGRVAQKLKSEFEPRGVTILGAGAGRLKVPDEVVDQLINNWQTEWQRRISEVEAATENAAMRRMKLAQARAEIEIIVTLTESIQAMQSSEDGQLTDIVTIRMLEAMREAAEDEQVKAMVPSQALETMHQLQDWLQDWGPKA
jgi:hypothetical protein